MKTVMVDSSTLFSGLLFKGKPNQILNLIRRKRLKLILSVDQLDEMYRVFERDISEKTYLLDSFLLLARPNFVDRSKYVNSLKPASELIRDEKDIPILACALSIKPDFFVSSDKDFNTDEIKEKISVVTPSEFLKLSKRLD